MSAWLGCAAVPVLWCVMRLRGGLGGKETMDQMERKTASCPFFSGSLSPHHALPLLD
jgi:hypothetical protein